MKENVVGKYRDQIERAENSVEYWKHATQRFRESLCDKDDECRRLRAALERVANCAEKDEGDLAEYLKYIARAALAGTAETGLESPQAPIATVTINSLGQPCAVAVYAPGLPPGDHALYCVPASVAPAVPASDGPRVTCGGCRRGVVMPFTDATRTRVALAPVTGWESHAGRMFCPECVKDPRLQFQQTAPRITPPPPVSADEMNRPFGPADGSGDWSKRNG
jgi:hypothetical protein